MGLFKKKDKPTKLRDALSFDGKRISYAVEMIDGEEKHLGKDGGISVNADSVVILLEAKEAARFELKSFKAGTLMSGNGADITGFDINENRPRHIITYYSKLKQ